VVGHWEFLQTIVPLFPFSQCLLLTSCSLLPCTQTFRDLTPDLLTTKHKEKEKMPTLAQDMLDVLIECINESSISDFVTSFLQRMLDLDPIEKSEILIYKDKNTIDTLAVGEKGWDRNRRIELKDPDHFFTNTIIQHTRKKRTQSSPFPFFFVPMYNGNSILGLLTIYCNKYIRYEQDNNLRSLLFQKFFSLKLQSLIDQMEKSKLSNENILLENNNQYIKNQISSLSKELYSISSIATYITPTLDLKAFIHKTLMKLNSIFKSNVIALYIHDETKGLLNTIDFFPKISSKRQEGIQDLLKNTFLDDVKLLQKPTTIRNSSTFWKRYCQHPEFATYKTIVCSPLQSCTFHSGVIFLLHEDDIEYDQNSIRLLSGISNIIGMAIENKILFHHSQQKIRQEDFIIQSIKQFHEQQNLKKTLKTVIEKVTEYFGRETHAFLFSNTEIPLVCSSYRQREDCATISSKAYQHIQSSNLKKIAQHIFKLKKSVLIPNLKNQSKHNPIHEYFQKKGMVSLLSVPIFDKNEHFGDMLIVTGSPEKSFTTSDMHMLQAMTDGASIAIHNARHFSKTEHNAELLETLIHEKNIQLNKIYETQHIRIDNRKDMIFWSNTDKEFVFINKAMEMITGYSREEIYLKGITTDAFLSSQHQPLLQKIFDAIINGDQSIISDLQIIHIDQSGREHTLLLTLTPLKDTEDHIIGVEGVGRDITEKKRLEKEIERNKTLAVLGECSSAIAHQMRTPLSNLLMGTKRLQQNLRPNSPHLHNQVPTQKQMDRPSHNTTNEQSEILNEMSNEIHQMDQIVTQLLEYTKSLTLRSTQQDINLLIQDLLDCFAGLFNQHAIHTQTFLNETLPLLSADTILLSQAIENILHNAVQAMAKGGTLTVTTSIEKRHNEYVMISIQDTGPGLNKTECKKIFQPFYTTKEHGTGLGLSLSHRIIEAHHGQIWATQNDPHGLQINILLPHKQHMTSFREKEQEV
jgi:PAS domain S-box-containing protein